MPKILCACGETLRYGEIEELAPVPPGAEMDPSRRRELRGSLESRLEEAARARGLGAAERAAWVAAHLEEYVERWLGMLDLLPSSASEITGDAFGLVRIGADVLTRELRDADPPRELLLDWIAFLALLDELREQGGREWAPRLLDAVRRVRSRLPPTAIPG